MAKRVEATIVGKQQVNHDSYIYSFRWDDDAIPFSIGQHFKIVKHLPTHEHPEGELLLKKYTPINPCKQLVRLPS